MLLDAILPPVALSNLPEIARSAEAMGFHGLWSTETQHDPFLPLALAAEHTQRIQLGTAIAVAFVRSPTVLAHTAWDLAEASHGRFLLGLGTQVRAHIERRFGMPWPDSPAGKLRDLIAAMRAVWRSWQEGGRLFHRGPYHTLSLMTPFFNPGPIDHPVVPVYIAGVNPALCRLAGEVADGFLAHPYHSAGYLRHVVRPEIDAGAERAGRAPGDIRMCVTALAATDESEAEFVRSQIAFYASTPTYRSVMDYHGWGETADRLRALSKQMAWGEMPSLVTDEMLSTFAVIASEQDLADSLLERYRGMADRLSLYLPYMPGTRDEFWRRLVAKLGPPCD
jgi:probable F420-dependent oxidoreductase